MTLDTPRKRWRCGLLRRSRLGEAKASLRRSQVAARNDAVEAAASIKLQYALNRLLIDLSWNSSRLEGNTYSLLDTQHLIDLGEEAEGREVIQKIADLFCFPGYAVQALARRAAALISFAYWCMHFQAR